MGDFLSVNYSMFFDRPKVMRAVRDGSKSVYARFGAFIRTSARSSIRQRKRVAAAGSPPSSHDGRLRDFIFFGYDDRTETTVVGPALFKRQSPTAPNLLEFGGQVQGDGRVIYVTREAGRDESGRFVSQGKKRVELNGQITYRAFPFMSPALDKNVDKFPGLFSGAIKG